MSGALAGPTLSVSRREADVIAARLRREAGLNVDPAKLDYIGSRISRLIRATGRADVAEYLAALDQPGEAQRLVEAFTVHTTGFFRERRHFDWLEEEGLPTLVAAGAGRERPLAFWSAACSIGAELWSAAMTVDRFARRRNEALRWRMIGTDVSHGALRRAQSALYTEPEVEGVDDDFLRDCFLIRRPRPGDAHPRILYRIRPELREKARFAYANLSRLDRGPEMEVDVVLLRNVLIYFSAEDQLEMVRQILRRIRPGGYLLTGHSESLGDRFDTARVVAASIYQRL